MKALIAPLAALGIALSACNPDATGTLGRTGPPPHRVIVGDSIALGHDPGYPGFGQHVPGATLIGGSGQDPVFFGWETQLEAAGPADVIVLQDYVLADWQLEHRPAWEAAWRSLVITAHELAPRVFILVGGPGAPFLASLPGIHVTMPAADHPDGIHFTEDGARRLGAIVDGLR